MSSKNKKKKKKNTNTTKTPTKQKGRGFKMFTRIGAIVLVFALAIGMIALYI